MSDSDFPGPMPSSVFNALPGGAAPGGAAATEIGFPATRFLPLFANVAAHRNHLGLPSEAIAPNTGALLGNFPQTCFQVGVILGAMRLSRS
jgi:GH15 family glucan-1,4-alpha-glucosidase